MVKEAQNSSTLSVSDRPALALFVVLAGVSDYKEIPALLEKYKAMIAGVGDDGMMACSSSPSRLRGACGGGTGAACVPNPRFARVFRRRVEGRRRIG